MRENAQCISFLHQSRTAIVILLALLLFAPNAQTAPTPAEATQNGRAFLVKLLDPQLGLLPEYRGAKVYWLFHDNYLAAKVLAASDPQIAQTIRAAIAREGIQKSGKIELIFGEAKKPLPFHQYQLMDVRRGGNYVIRTEVVTATVFVGWEEYADLLLMASIAEANPSAARQHWNVALRMWDGKGFNDAATRAANRYATYKLSLALLAAHHLSPPARPPEGLLDRLLSLQDESGGWITDYDGNGKKIGKANVETTSLTILGIETVTGRPKTLAK